MNISIKNIGVFSLILFSVNGISKEKKCCKWTVLKALI